MGSLNVTPRDCNDLIYRLSTQETQLPLHAFNLHLYTQKVK
jgi:hypothetical protein